ncbi:MAG: dihydrodipicolinate synthase family protein [Bryobacterales bacterium]|nr:dihydrodipicolinate synthase family protein [Bryobacterales bacterium]
MNVNGSEALPVLTPEMFAELTPESTLAAIKESSGGARRITDAVNLLGNRYILFSGAGRLMLESVLPGVQCRVSCPVNAFPAENARWDLVASGRWREAREFYRRPAAPPPRRPRARRHHPRALATRPNLATAAR